MTTEQIINLRVKLQDIEELMVSLSCLSQDLSNITTQANELTLDGGLPQELEEKLKRIKKSSMDLLVEVT